MKRYIINGRPVGKDTLTQQSETCKHEIITEKIEGTNYRYCKHCGMKAHEDDSFSYFCGFEYCKCCN